MWKTAARLTVVWVALAVMAVSCNSSVPEDAPERVMPGVGTVPLGK